MAFSGSFSPVKIVGKGIGIRNGNYDGSKAHVMPTHISLCFTHTHHTL